MHRFIRVVFRSAALFLVLTIEAKGVEFTKIVDHGPDSNRAVLVAIGEGYQAGQQARFNADVDSIVAAFRTREPWKTYWSLVNVYRFNFVSEDSGVDYPARGINANTAFDGFYTTGIMFRNLDTATTVLNATLTRWHGCFVVVNVPEDDGGAPGRYAIFDRNSTPNSIGNVALHEMGHAFGGGLLADEYSGTSPMPSVWEPNVAVLPDTAREGPHAVKWAKWLNSPGVGLFLGAKYSMQAFRSEDYCIMQTGGGAFCRVCSEALCLKIHEYVNTIESSNPPNGTAFYNVYDTRYEFSLLDTANIKYAISWELDFATMTGEQGTSVVLHPWNLGQNPHVLKAIVTDTTRYNYWDISPNWIVENTPFTRNDPLGLMADTITWYLQFTPDARIVSVAAAPNSHRSFVFADNRFFVGQGNSNFVLRIYDMRGRLLQSFSGSHGAANLPWHNPSSGIYVIRLNSGPVSQTQKIAIR